MIMSEPDKKQPAPSTELGDGDLEDVAGGIIHRPIVDPSFPGPTCPDPFPKPIIEF
jgi:hypothetical protein